MGVREVIRPGSTAHKAGPDALRRLQNLEQGAAGRPGPGVANGSVLTSDITQPGGARWDRRGSQAGYIERTSNKDDTLNNGAVGTNVFSSALTLTGDNIHYMWLEFWASNWRCTNGAGQMIVAIREGSTTGTDYGYTVVDAAAPSNKSMGDVFIRRRLAPFSGTINLYVAQINTNIGAGAVLRLEAQAAVPIYLSAVWGEKA